MIAKLFNSRPLQAIGLLVSMTVGVGIFAVPFVFARAGLIVGLVELAALAIVVAALNMMFAEVALRTDAMYRLPGYAGMYLGLWAKVLALGSYVIGFVGALLAYLIVGGGFLARVLSVAPFSGVILFFGAGAILLYLKFPIGAKANYFLTALFVAGILLLSFAAFHFFHASNVIATSWGNALVPYGVLLFAISGGAIIPDIVFFLGDRKDAVKKVILVSSGISLCVYALFAVSMVGAFGVSVSGETLESFGGLFGPRAAWIAHLIGFFTTFTSFLLFGMVFERMLRSDAGMGRVTAWLLTILFPLALFFVGFSDYVAVIGLVGAVAIGLDNIILIMMHRAASVAGAREPEFLFSVPFFLRVVFILLFAGGVVHEFISF